MVEIPVKEHIEEDFGNYLEDLIRLLSQPSISTTSEGVEECTELVQTSVANMDSTR